METLLEQQRRYHEERERLLDELVKEKLYKKSSHRETVNSEHRMKQLLDRLVEVTNMLKDLYEDKDGLRKEEVNALSGPNEFAEFYSRLKSITEFYHRHPNEISIPMSVEFQKYSEARGSQHDEANNYVDFTAEEGYGKHLDLHESFNKYINLKGVEKVDYITYLGIFDHLFEVPKERKNQEYRKYLDILLDYLIHFTVRVNPLCDIDDELRLADEEFEVSWEAGSFQGWPKEQMSAMTRTGAHLDLSAFSSAEELASLGLDRLKSALLALGLKCGGTLEERAQRLFATKGKSLEDLEPGMFTKSKPGKTVKSTKDVEKQKGTAQVEARIYKIAEHLMEQKHATRDNVQRKQARTVGEEEDEEEAVSESDSDSDDDNDIPYNPKNLPLGWDGKPIPYWLYKLHGLNIDYVCEICGNFKYRGPKAFQRHFSESWRHAHGMRCLNIPNTAHFANVTSIEAAVALWDRIKERNERRKWQPDTEEEFEDSKGNVINKKIYEDLKRQGLL